MPTTRWEQIDPLHPDRELIRQASECLRGGGLVVVPTETVYGLAASAFDVEAVQRIYAAKGRPSLNPLIVHLPSAEKARALTIDWPETADLLAKRFWPGPLTMVLTKANHVPSIVTARGETVALRVPSHPVMQALLEFSGVPVAAPSANRSERLSATRAEHVRNDLDGRVDFVLDAGPTPGGIESTVIDLTGPARILRPGLIPRSELEEVLGPIADPVQGLSADSVIRSPGQMSRHYAPRAPLYRTDDPLRFLEQFVSAGKSVGWLSLGPISKKPAGITIIEMPNNPVDYAHRLFAELHTLDRLGVDVIVVTLPPDTEEWAAIQDRLRRAQTK